MYRPAYGYAPTTLRQRRASIAAPCLICSHLPAMHATDGPAYCPVTEYHRTVRRLTVADPARYADLRRRLTSAQSAD